MSFRLAAQESLSVAAFVAKWLLLTVPLGIVVGSACALFLAALDRVTAFRFLHPEILFALPLAGFAIGWLYHRLGRTVEAGANLIVDEIHEPGGGVPLRMTPLVLFGTLATHLFGGSAGREGTAVQMGGSLASGFARLFPALPRSDVRNLLSAGVSAGFGGVFGTPVAGTVFALEVISIGRMSYSAILPCLIAGLVSDQTCALWGIEHTHYHVASLLPPDALRHLAPWDVSLLVKAALASVLFGLCARCFSEMAHGVHHGMKRAIASPLLRPVVGGVLLMGLTMAIGTQDYLGLGVASPDPNSVTILGAFHPGGATPWSWFWKAVFTALTLGSGFKGGEVTPLFFIGATLGNVLAGRLAAPVDLFAALGFVAVFAGATNTPLACTVMAIELFGGEFTAYYAVACCLAYLFSGHSGVYLSQRLGTPKLAGLPNSEDSTLRDLRAGGDSSKSRAMQDIEPRSAEDGSRPL